MIADQLNLEILKTPPKRPIITVVCVHADKGEALATAAILVIICIFKVPVGLLVYGIQIFFV